ncbi:erythrocyte membrane-associated antigen [Babesia divergens]|uniref:Erythrocyte membrane-associated antigen n=1 Tax=Babesia divergens TaxID=32595 RepID=A0AAD9GFB6_BABDI|nr:erythrocyte membrane-associated antigen [Babesia divergens]
MRALPCCFGRLIVVAHITLLLLGSVVISAHDTYRHNLDVFNSDTIQVQYTPGTGYTIVVSVGKQDLTLKLMSSINGIVLFQKGTDACTTLPATVNCYDPKVSDTAAWCDNKDVCTPGTEKFKCNEVKSSDSIPAATTTDFRLDGSVSSMETLEGLEMITIRNDGLLKPLMFDNCPIKMANKVSWSSSRITPSGIDGMFGLAGGSISCREKCLWTQLLQMYDGFYVLDFNGDGNLARDTNTVALNGIHMGREHAKNNDVIWAEKRQVGGMFTDALAGFSVYGMSACGVNLFGRMSNYWHAEVDVSSQCLVLPKSFWISLMSQLPIIEDCYTGDAPRRCRLNRGGITQLPVLEFGLEQQGSSKILRIPLENLLLDNTETPELCIVPDETVSSTTAFADNPSIKFGYKVLESLNVIVDTHGHRVGFIHKNKVETNNEICAQRVECIGDQNYIPELNYCMQPFCNIWLFKRLDETTG